MLGRINKVRRHSLAEKAGVLSGEKLCTVNGCSVQDIIDLSFLTADDMVELEIENAAGERRFLQIEKYPDEDLGIEFEAAVFDKVRTCYNNCIFCFVDQMIPGMRPGLYVRDDDYRLSFLYGNFITLTNMRDEDFNRIIRTHLSPLYISVHATDPDVRCKMMNNRFAGRLMDKLKLLLEAGIQIHTQIVCCPGYNDGAVLQKTFEDLYALYPGVLTMAVVPVGLTKHREHLHPMRTFTAREAAEIVDTVSVWQKRCRAETGKSFVYLGDEFYLLAEKELPASEYYDGFPQLENGIGLTRNFLNEWDNALKTLAHADGTEAAIIPVGESAFRVLQPLMEQFNGRYATRHAFVPVKNLFFGGHVNVTGLLTGEDILQATNGCSRLILPGVVLNNDNLFLDDMSLESFRNSFKGKVEIAKDAGELLHLLTMPREG